MGILTYLIDSLLSGEDFLTSLKERVKEETERYNEILQKARGSTSSIGLEIYREVMEKELFGCQRANSLRILSIALGENLLGERGRVDIPLFSLVKVGDPPPPGYAPNIPYLFLGKIPPMGSHIACGSRGGLGENIPVRVENLKEVEEEDFKEFFRTFQTKAFLKGVVNGFEGN